MDEKEKLDEKDIQKEELHKIRIYLSSKKLSKLEKVCSDLANEARKKEVQVKGPHRLPRKRFKITTRKSPCGEGTNTYERWELRVYKRRIDITSPASLVKDITKIGIDPDVNIHVTVTQL